jgi:iron(II)-dependent oxidoreductase
LPPVEAVRRRLREVRAAVHDRLEAPPRLAVEGTAATGATRLEPRIALRLVLQHEAQHQETILQAIGLREDLDYRPGFAELAELAGTPVASGIVLDESIFVPAGAFTLGTNDRLDAYDNERPAHEVHMPAFMIDRSPVTNQRFLAFVRDGGYARREVWSEPGWAFVQRTGAQAPLHWRVSPARREGREEWEGLAFGRRLPLHPDAPVVHVSWFEADAYARWSGARLPTEAEWEKAAAWDPAIGVSRLFPWGDAPWEARLANLDQGRLEPAIIGTYPEGRSAYGCLQMLGDVWEWTSSCFDGYPGFESFPYREYSEIFFGQTYRVLRGGSFATRAVVARNTFRNWDLPERRQIFAGFRCARSA